MKMDKVYSDANGGEGVTPMSGGGSSMGSQWEMGLDRDEFQSILKSTLGNTGFEITTKNGKFDLHNGEISLEGEVDSLEIGRLSIQDEELEEMRKQQQADSIVPLAEGQCASDEPKEKTSPAQDKNTDSSHLSCKPEVASSADDVLNDIASVIASSLSPADDHLVSDLEDCDGLLVANVQSGNCFNTEFNKELVERKHMTHKAYFSSTRGDFCHSSPHSDGYTSVGCGNTEQMSSPSSVTHQRVASPSAPNISSRKECGPLEGGQRKVLTVFTTPDSNMSQVATGMTISPEGRSRKVNQQKNNCLVTTGDVMAQQVLDDVCSPVSEGNRHSVSISSGKQDAGEDKSTLSESDSCCQMCPLEYTADDEDDFVDFDENCISGELIAHGRGSSRGRPKTVRPPKGATVQREIRPKPSPSGLISVTLKETASKNCLEVCPVVTAETSHRACLPLGIPSVVNDVLGQPLDRNIIRPEQSKSSSMDCMEGDGPVSYITQSHHSGQGQILASNVYPHIQGYTVTQQAPQHQPVTNYVIRDQPMKQVNFPQQVREVYCREEPQYDRHKQPVYPLSMVDSHGNLHLHNHVNKNGASGYHKESSYSQVPITAYSEVRPERSDLVLVSRKDLERAGIPLIPLVDRVASHPRVHPGVHTLTESNKSQQHYTSTTPLQINPAEQSFLQQGGQVYNSVAVRNQPPHYSQSSRPRKVVQYQGQPQNDKPATYYSNSHASPNNINLHSSSNVPSGSQLAHPVTAQPRHTAMIPSKMSSEDHSKLQAVTLRDGSVMSASGSVRLSHGSSTSINSRLDSRDMPKEDTYRRTEAWIREISPGASHHAHPYESNRFVSHIDAHSIPVSVVNSNMMYVPRPSHEIASSEGADMTIIKRPANSKKGQGNAKEASKYKAGAGAKVRQSKEKKVDTNNSHQDYLRQLPGKSDDILKGQLLHQLGQSGLAPPRDVANAITNDFFWLQRQSQSEMETSKKMTSPSDARAEADTEIEKIILEKFNRSAQNHPPILDESRLDSLCPVTRDQKLERLSQTYHIDQSQYLNVEDKESLEKKVKQRNNSLDRYLMPGNNLCESNFEQVLTASQFGAQHTPQRDFQVSLQPPTEMVKINITAWAQQSDAITEMTPPVSSSGHANHPFDLTNPNAKDFSLMLQSLTGSEDENMKSASLGHCGTTDGQKLMLPQAYPSNNCHLPNAKPDNNLTTCTASNVSMINAKTVPPRTGEQCFQKPVQPAVKQPPQVSQRQDLKNDATQSHQACLSACISHPQSLMPSAVASLQSQPMSSLRGDSDISMQSDLSRHSKRDRSMNSVTGISGGQTQNQELYNMSSNMPELLSAKQPKGCKHKSVKEWLERQTPFLNQQEKQSPDCQNMHQASLKMHTAVPSHNPQTVRQIDQHDLIPVGTQQQQPPQQHHVLQNIPPPSSPSHDQYRNMYFQGLADDQEEAGYGSFVVPGFTATDLLPRCGGSCKPTASTSRGSSASQDKEATKPSQKQTASNASRGVPKEKSPPIAHMCNKQSLKSQKNNKSTCHSSSSTTLSSPTVLSSSSKVPQISPSNTTVHDTLTTNRDSQAQMSSSRTSTVVTSCQVKPSLSNVYYNNSNEAKASCTTSSDQNNDLIIVGEKMKTSVKISHGYSSPYQCQKADLNNDVNEKEEEDEDDDEEEEVSFSGSDVFRPDDQGETILHCLCDISRNLLEDLASAPGFLEALNISNKAQETPLFVGVHNGRKDVAAFLIKHGADTSVSCISPPNAFRSESLLQSVLHEAAELGDVKTLNALLKSETADIDLPRPCSGQTPLMVALHVHSFTQRNPSANRSKVIKFLLTQDASMSIQDSVEGKTPFMYAVLSRDVEIVKRFLSVMDADEARQAVTAKTNRSATCLHFAASLSKFDRTQKVELIRLLILAGAEASVKNAEGESPRDWAHDEMTEVFKKLAPPK